MKIYNQFSMTRQYFARSYTHAEDLLLVLPYKNKIIAITELDEEGQRYSFTII
jgi:hypothetical protein